MPRTIRQRRSRARKGQVAAVATTLALLLVVTYLSNYLVYQLPGQMGQVEFEHLVQVEDQLARLQATVFAQAARPYVPISIESPITLGSPGEPPFGPPSAGTIGPEPSSVAVSGAYQLNSVTPSEPNWGAFSACLPGGSGHCAGNGNVNYANLSGNRTALSVTITGGTNSLVYNINGNNDSLTVSWNGKDAGIVAIVINGSHDTVSFNKGGSDTTVPTMNFYFFGQNDTFSMSLSGSHSSHGGMNVGVAFIGSLGLLCPYGNLSSSDSVAALGAGGSNLNMTVAWWNADGYVTAPNVTAYPGSSIPAETITWENNTGSVACPYLKVSTATFPYGLHGGLDVHLSNIYQPPDDLSFEDGAVLLSNPGEQSIMIDPPDFSFDITNSGLRASLTLFQLTGTLTTESGVTTAGVGTRVLSVTASTVGAGVDGAFLGTPYFVNVTTLFPAAWMTYFNGQGSAFPAGATCIIPHPPLVSGYSCLAPPPGTPIIISAPLYAQSVSVTTVQVVVQIY
ncbi:MAG: hypothetical protein L3K08_05525 [Thermoplasmata archaeon]|nr:hypothetical protein [Thermoplasmata archaeon]